MRRDVSVVDRTWGNIYSTFSSSLGTILLLIENCYDPLHLWVIKGRCAALRFLKRIQVSSPARGSSPRQIQYVPRYPYFVTGWGHRKIEPKTKHCSRWKKNQSSWPNQTDNSTRYTKISNHAYKNSKKSQIIFIYNLIINPQFIESRQTYRKRRLHRIDLQENRGEHCIEDQREREEAI